MSYESISATLHTLLPEFDFGRLSSIGSGFTSVAVESETGYIIKMARYEEATQFLEKEYRVLSDPSCSFGSFVIPRPIHLSKHDSFPYAILVYRKLKGVPLDPNSIRRDPEHWVHELAELVDTVQSVSLSEDLHSYLSYYPPPRAPTDEFWRTILPYLQDSMTTGDVSALQSWWSSAVRYLHERSFDPVFLHGDLWYENILIDPDERTVVGLLDFEQAHYGDPLADLAPMKYYGEDFFDRFITYYQEHYDTSLSDGYISTTVDYYLGLREFEGLYYGLRVDVIDDDQLDKIRDRVL